MVDGVTAPYQGRTLWVGRGHFQAGPLPVEALHPVRLGVVEF